MRCEGGIALEAQILVSKLLAPDLDSEVVQEPFLPFGRLIIFILSHQRDLLDQDNGGFIALSVSTFLGIKVVASFQRVPLQNLSELARREWLPCV